jgi:hypothetical protein
MTSSHRSDTVYNRGSVFLWLQRPSSFFFQTMYPAQSSTDGGSQSRTSFNEKALQRPRYEPRSPSAKSIVTVVSRRKFDIKGFLSKLWGLPLFVICGQLILQIAAWGFFAYIQSRGFLPLPRRFQGDRSADWYRPLTWLSTQISAGLAGLSC